MRNIESTVMVRSHNIILYGMKYLQLDRFHSQGRPIVKHPVEFPPIEVAIGCIHLQAHKKKGKTKINIIIGILVQQNFRVDENFSN